MKAADRTLRGVSFITLSADPRVSIIRAKILAWGAEPYDSIEELPEGSPAIGIALAIASSEEGEAVDALMRRHPTPPVVLLLDLPHCREYVASRAVPHVCWLDELTSEALSIALAKAAADAPLQRLRSLLEQRARPADWLARKAIAHLLAPPGGAAPHTLEGLAVALGCSPDHLTRMLKKGGVRASMLVRWSRLIRALALRMQGLSWHAVAELLGFASESNLAHFVKRLTGHAPRQLEKTVLTEGRTMVAAAIDVAQSEIFI